MSKKTFEQQIRLNQRINGIKPSIIVKTEQIMNTTKNNNKSKGIVAMAIAKGQESIDTKEIKRYIGIASCRVLGICPTKEALDTIYGHTSENAPKYIGETDVNGVKVPQARIDILFKLDPEKYLDSEGKPIETVFRKSIFLTKTPQANRDNTKFKVTDRYGRTAWVTEAQLAAHEIPQYSNGPANIGDDYRTLYQNEEVIINFLIAFLNLPNVQTYNRDTKTWSMIADPSVAEVRPDEIDKYFTGNFRELQEAYNFRSNNKVKVLFGVKTVDGKTYQDIYDMFLKNGTSNYSKLENNLEERKSNGGYPSTEFKVCELREWNVEATNFNKTSAPKSNPFENNNDDMF
jgi:hypothetical protein